MTTQTPASFGDGRYTVSRLIGEGNAKRVYQCHDEILDRDVAVALLKADGLDGAAIERAFQDVEVLSQLGEHPAIVPIYDHVVNDGDRLDSLAFRYLGDAEQWWRIADANPALDPRDLTSVPGNRIRITLPEGVPGNG